MTTQPDQRTCPGFHPPQRPATQLRPDEYLCGRCSARAVHTIKEFPAAFAELTLTLTGQATGGNVVGRKRDKGESAPLPFNEGASDTGADVLARLREWAEHVAAVDHVPPDAPAPARHRGQHGRSDLHRSIDLLIEHATFLRRDPQGPDLADAVRWCNDQIRARIDRRERRWFAGECGAPVTNVELVDAGPGEISMRWQDGHCTRDLYARAESSVIVCDGYREGRLDSGCGALHPALARHKYVMRVLRSKLLPLDAILSAARPLTGRSVEPDLVRKWRQRKKLRPIVCLTKHVDQADRARCRFCRGEMYSGGQVLDLVLDDKARTGPKRRDQGRVSA